MKIKLSELKNLKSNLKGNKFRTKKGLGQNFLVNNEIALQIVDGAALMTDDIVLEIGSGVGSLTGYIASRVKRVITVEVDREAIPILKKNIIEFSNIEIINKDILKVDLKGLFQKVDSRIKVVANLPYYIASSIIKYILKSDISIFSVTVMVQKEVGERLIAKAGTKNYGILTLVTAYYAEIEKIIDVDKENFHPIPSVDSMVVKLVLKNKGKFLSKEEEKNFFKLVKAGFNTRRKNLLNSFAVLFAGDKEKVKIFLEACGIDGNRRGETLSLEEYISLSKVVISEK